jgi:penicillin-binding protein 1A
MESALGLQPVVRDVPVEQAIDGNLEGGFDAVGNLIDGVPEAIGAAADRLQDLGIDVRQGEDGSITVGPRDRPFREEPPSRDDRDRDRRPPPEDGEE